MSRSGEFRHRNPLDSHPLLDLDEKATTGPFRFLNPTKAHFNHVPPEHVLPDKQTGEPTERTQALHGEDSTSKDIEAAAANGDDDHQPASNIKFKWRARDNRKGRHTLMVQPVSPNDPQPKVIYLTPRATTGLRATLKGLKRMITQFPVWDISFDVAFIFTLGSVIWVINSFFSWLPDVDPSTLFDNETLYAGGITAFIGATVFEIGSILLIVEAVNENREGCFGWALERALYNETPQKALDGDTQSDGQKTFVVKPDKDNCRHHHTNKGNWVGKGTVKSSAVDLDTPSVGSNGDADMKAETEEVENVSVGNAWQWLPTWHDFVHHYLRELGFLAGFAQFWGATIFWISGFTALPGIQNKLSQPTLNGVFWVPQIVGGSGFIISGTLYMLETQERWYKPALGVLGWHIGFWNWIGAIGFTLCGALGPAATANSGASYESSLATFWGSWAFLIGSTLQWYESLDKHPVEIMKDDGKSS